jgi:CRP/FNR family transcriptional regulator, cyclic AMP receptor protein
MVDRTLIAENDLFSGLSDDEIDRLVSRADTRTFHRGDIVFAEDEESSELFIVSDGRIAISNRSIDGRESMVALMEQGDIFGEMSLFDGLTRSAEARALEASHVLALPYAPMRELYESEPLHLWKVVELLAIRLRLMDSALADSVFLDVTGRTAKRLLEIAGVQDEFALPITQEELAGMVGASRERVNKAIASFVRLGWLEQTDRRYRILDRDQLTRRAR